MKYDAFVRVGAVEEEYESNKDEHFMEEIGEQRLTGDTHVGSKEASYVSVFFHSASFLKKVVKTMYVVF